eukprot:TRINITY_DN412_c1_g1_i2.p1 TRINITY_DN412_c1_g1~~TRINITY_DN412_c1_g1_i2.p1  ORF type:complete len:371 (-),score=95.61 TRINITY_DN412_c1_g1_i2:18-1130(-)
MSLKVYLFHLSQPSRSVYNFLIENNIQYEEIIVDLAKGEHRGEQFLKINPQGTVPAINDNGLSLSESSAIMIHLAQTRKLPDHWYPSDPQAKAAVNQYLHWHHQNLRKGGMSFFYSYFMKDEQKKNQALNDFHEASKRIEERLKNSTNGYICNTTGPSIADFLAFHEYVSQVEYGIVDLSDKDYPHIKKWYNRLKHRESCRKTVEIAVELFRKLFPQSNENQDLSSNGLFKSDSQLSSVNKNWGNPSGEKEIEITKKSLEEKKHKVNVVSSEQEALELIKKVIPSGSSVYSAGSTTLSEIGFVDYLKGETPYNNIKSSILSEKDPKKQQELYRQGMFADYFVSSITKKKFLMLIFFVFQILFFLFFKKIF